MLIKEVVGKCLRRGNNVEVPIFYSGENIGLPWFEVDDPHGRADGRSQKFARRDTYMLNNDGGGNDISLGDVAAADPGE
jgi:hypothetical protein